MTQNDQHLDTQHQEESRESSLMWVTAIYYWFGGLAIFHMYKKKYNGSCMTARTNMLSPHIVIWRSQT